jgi:hypothetical protein
VLAAALTSGPSAAQQYAAATGAAAGAAAGARASEGEGPLVPLPLPGRELEDWKDPRTGTTAYLFDECATLIELRLTTVGPWNYLWMKLENGGDAPIVVRPNLVKARIGEHPWRRLHSPQGYSHRSITPGWLTWFVFRFDDKQEFGGARTIDLELPLESDQGKRCTVRARMVRPANVAEDPVSSVVHTKLGLWLAFGTGLAATGGLDRLGGADFAFEIGFDFYPWLHHGFFLDLFVESYQSFDPADFSSRIPAFGRNPRIVGVGPIAGYLFRVQPLYWLPISVGAGFGPYVVDIADQDNDAYFEEAFLASMLRAQVDGFFATIPDDSRLSVRLAGYALAVPDGEFGPVELSGVSVGALLGIAIAR